MKKRLSLAIVVTFAATASASLAAGIPAHGIRASLSQARSYVPGAYVPGGSSGKVARAIEARGYAGSPALLASSYFRHAYVPGGSSVQVAKTIQARGYAGSPAPLASSYSRQAYVPGGSSVQVAKTIQARGYAGSPAAASITSSPRSGSSFSWGDAGIGAAAWTGLLLLLIGGSLIALRRKGALAH